MTSERTILIACQTFNVDVQLVRNGYRIRDAVDARRCAALLLARQGVGTRRVASDLGQPIRSALRAIQSARELAAVDQRFAQRLESAWQQVQREEAGHA